MGLVLKSILICVILVEISCFKTHSALNSIIFTNLAPPLANVHSEYYFGRCATDLKVLLLHEHYKYEDIKGNLLIRAYLNITQVPNCVYIKASSPFGDMVRYNAYKFTVCNCRIVHNFLGNKYVYHFYEWFIPVEMQEGIDWDLYFFHSTFE